MTLMTVKLKQDLCNRKVIKIISGLSNFNLASIIKTIKAAEISGATYIDVASNPKLVKVLKSVTNLPICVSSIEPQDLYNCLLAGADILEIGNYDVFYDKGIQFSTFQIIQLVNEIKSFSKDKFLCVTIPHTLLLQDKVYLAQVLFKEGVNMVQTEGSIAKGRFISDSKSLILQTANFSSSALSTAYAISKYTNMPVIASSGINSVSAPIAISYGASGVGVCSSLLNYNSIIQKANYINQIISSLSLSTSQQKFYNMQTLIRTDLSNA